MKTVVCMLGLAGAIAVAGAQTNPPAAPPDASAEATNAPTAAPGPSDLELHPFRIFAGKHCTLLPLLAWEHSDPARRRGIPNPMPLWKPFHGTVLQVLHPGMFFQEGRATVYIKDYPAPTGLTNGQRLAFHAIRYGTSPYTNTAGFRLEVPAYGYGIPFNPATANTRTNLLALYRARQIKAIDDRLAFLKQADSRLHEEEMRLKRVESAYRQTTRARAYEQFQTRQLQNQRTLIRRQVADLTQQKTQLQNAPLEGPPPGSGRLTNASTNLFGRAPTNRPGYP
jgi:hypothetical protein